MRKIQVFCDDCGKEVKLQSNEELVWQDICPTCIKARITQSFFDYPVGSMTCKKCKNTKMIRVADDYNNNYEMRTEYKTIACPDCANGVKLKK